MDYQYFRKTIEMMLIDGYLMPDHELNDLYTSFKNSREYSLTEWVAFWFEDWTMEEHGFELKVKYKDNKKR